MAPWRGDTRPRPTVGYPALLPATAAPHVPPIWDGLDRRPPSTVPAGSRRAGQICRSASQRLSQAQIPPRAARHNDGTVATFHPRSTCRAALLRK